MTDWRLIEQDLETLERTGCWPTGDPPAWAKEFIDNFPTKRLRVATIIDFGLREIIRQLKQELWRTGQTINETLNSSLSPTKDS